MAHSISNDFIVSKLALKLSSEHDLSVSWVKLQCTKEWNMSISSVRALTIMYQIDKTFFRKKH